MFQGSILSGRRGLLYRGATLSTLLIAGAFALAAPTHAQKRAMLASRIEHLTVSDEILVTLAPDADNEIAAKQFAALGATTRHLDGLHSFHIRLKRGADRDAVLARLRQSAGVAAAEPNHVVRAADITLPNDPYFGSGQGAQWGPLRTETYLAWSIWKPCNVKPVVIAIVDTGVDSTHPDLANMMLRDAGGNVVGYNALTHLPSVAYDDFWHGTHCAGVAAAQTNNGTGIAGMAGWTGNSAASDTTHVKVMPVKVLDNNGNGSDSGVAEGITWAADHGANVISLSLGSPDPSYVLSQAVAYAWNKGCVVCAAAGNYGLNAKFYPAYTPNTVSVAATVYNTADSLASYSEWGTWVKVAAPGDGIYSTVPGGGYNYASGTSMATPHVAGLAALLWAQNPRLTNQQIISAITGTVDKYPANANPIAPGSGRINTNSAVKSVQANTPVLSGAITLEGCVNAAQTITLNFASTDGLIAGTYSVILTPIAPGSSTGRFTLQGLPDGSYKVSIKGGKWLQKDIFLPAPLASAPPVAITLLAGDSNNDNVVDIGDFGELVNAYNSSGSNPQVDFNCDNVIDISDFALLVNNYGTQGDP